MATARAAQDASPRGTLRRSLTHQPTAARHPADRTRPRRTDVDPERAAGPVRRRQAADRAERRRTPGPPQYPAAPPPYGAGTGCTGVAVPGRRAPQYPSAAPYGAAPGGYGQPGGDYGRRGGGYGDAYPKNNLGVWALVLGIVSFVVVCGLLTGIPAIIVGNNAKKAVAQGEANNGGLATAGVILGWVAIAFSRPRPRPVRRAPRRAT